MNRAAGERFRFYLLIGLVMTSLFQVGILWNVKYYGFSIDFLKALFVSTNSNYSVDTVEFFKPYRIVVSEGFDDSHWILNDSVKEYSILWQDAKLYITKILKNLKPVSKIDFTENVWGELIVKKALILEFKTVFDQDMLKGLLGIEQFLGSDPEGIYKVIVLPYDDVNNNFIIYIYDGLKKIYKFITPIDEKGLSKSDYSNIISSISQNDNLTGYAVIKEVIPDTDKALFKMQPDIPVIVEGNKYRKVDSINCTLPKIFETANLNENSDLSKVASIVLNSEKDDYAPGVDVQGSIVFKNLNNVFRIHKNGLFEYKNLNTVEESQKNDEMSAFERALNFIGSRKKLVSGVEIFLSGVEKYTDSYTFKFDYKVNQIPVLIEGFSINTGSEGAINNAIVVNSNSKNVLSCRWVLRNFQSAQEFSMINVSLENLLEDTFNIYNKIDQKIFSIKDIDMSYQLNRDKNIRVLNPVWVIKDMYDKNYIVPARVKKGD